MCFCQICKYCNIALSHTCLLGGTNVLIVCKRGNSSFHWFPSEFLPAFLRDFLQTFFCVSSMNYQLCVFIVELITVSRVGKLMGCLICCGFVVEEKTPIKYLERKDLFDLPILIFLWWTKYANKYISNEKHPNNLDN